MPIAVTERPIHTDPPRMHWTPEQYEALYETGLLQEIWRHVLCRCGQTRGAGQQSLLHGQNAENGFHDARSAQGVAQHSF